MTLGNGAFYEIGFRKTNGSIAYITDKSTGQNVSQGSRYGCLWGASLSLGSPNFVGGCSYESGGANKFLYSWDSTRKLLTFTYTTAPGSSQGFAATVKIFASDSSSVDMQLQVTNHWGAIVDYIDFPCDLVFYESEVQGAYLPILPGVVLNNAFFAQHRTYGSDYPGSGMFADYVHLNCNAGNFSEYSLYEPGALEPVYIGLNHDDAYIAGSTYLSHSFGARVANDSMWNSPTVRLRISSAPIQTMLNYRADNGIGSFPPISAKTGQRYTQVTRSPLIKIDAAQLGIPFNEYSNILGRIPSPAIIHNVAYEPGGFDKNYPDLLPPAPQWGTTSDFAKMMQQAHSENLLFMPYTNPTWWDGQSPTLQSLPAPYTLDSVTVINDQSQPDVEYYGSNGGYVVCPFSPFVRQRVAQLVGQMTTEVPSDFVFEDQVGARPWMFDHNPRTPYQSAYCEGWIQMTDSFPNLLMTEQGFDRLAKSMLGFHGSVLLSQREGYTTTWWGTGTWQPFPVAPLMARDKVLFYQHDLATQTMTADKATLSWNLAFGYMLSYDLVVDGQQSPWLNLVSLFQKYVIAPHVGENITGFTNIAANATQTNFENYTVVANLDSTHAFAIAGDILSPLGVYVSSNDGTIKAGVYTTYNGTALSSGDHYLIEERDSTSIIIRQPIGAATSISTPLLGGWNCQDSIEVVAYDSVNSRLGTFSSHVNSDTITSQYVQQLSGTDVAYAKMDRVPGLFVFSGPRWNMLSVPVIPENLQSVALFPGASGGAWTYSASSGKYESPDTLQLGAGYWVQSPSPTRNFMGGPLLTVDTIAVVPGWNMIGSIGVPVPFGKVVVLTADLTPGALFGYTNGYVRADTIQPGKGYWIKANKGGLIVLATPQAPPRTQNGVQQHPRR